MIKALQLVVTFTLVNFVGSMSTGTLTNIESAGMYVLLFIGLHNEQAKLVMYMGWVTDTLIFWLLV